MSVLLLLASLAAAQPAVDVSTPTVEAPKVEAPKAEEPKKEEPKKEEPARASAEEELRFYQKLAGESDTDLLKAVAVDLESFAEAHAGTPLAAEALAELAPLQQKLNDSTSLVTWLRLIYEFPGTPQAADARSQFLSAAEKRLPRRMKDAAAELSRAPSDGDAPKRLATLLERLSGEAAEALHDPALAFAARFEARFPGFAEGDRAAMAEGRLRESVQDWPAAALAYRRLLALYPRSPLRGDALWARGTVLTERMKDHQGAVAAFHELVQKHETHPQALPALERSATLLADKLKRPELAVEDYQLLVTRYPGTAAARRALLAEAKLERGKLNKYADAVKSLEKVAEQYPTSPDAPEALYEAAQIYEDDMNDATKAVAEYKSVASKFPQHKLGRKAEDRAAKLDAKSAPKADAKPEAAKP